MSKDPKGRTIETEKWVCEEWKCKTIAEDVQPPSTELDENVTMGSIEIDMTR